MHIFNYFKKSLNKSWLFWLVLFSPITCAEPSTTDTLWETTIKEKYYGQRKITESNEVFEVDIAKRAEDPSITPVKFNAKIAQSPDYYIKTISFFIDNNPEPFTVRFHMMPSNIKADLAFRVRVNTYSYYSRGS